MTRTQLLRAVRAQGLPARTWHVDLARDAGLEPQPARDGGGRLIYSEEHVDQVAAVVKRAVKRRRLRALRKQLREEATSAWLWRSSF